MMVLWVYLPSLQHLKKLLRGPTGTAMYNVMKVPRRLASRDGEKMSGGYAQFCRVIFMNLTDGRTDGRMDGWSFLLEVP